MTIVQPAPTSDPVTLRAFIVDDSRRFLVAARRLLESQGLAVVGTVSTAVQAVRRIEQLHPDVVLLDIVLDGESGFQLARRLHRDGGLTTPPVVLISIRAEDDYADLVAESPAVGFLPKTALSAAAIRDLLQ